MATGCVPGARLLDSWPGASSSSSSSSSSRALVRVGPRAASSAAPPQRRHRTLRPGPVANTMIRVPPARCLPPSTPESPLEPPSLWQKLLQAYKRISKKHLLLIILLAGCVAVGFLANKGDPRALFIVDVLDKANKAYKPCSEFVVLLMAIIVSLFPR